MQAKTITVTAIVDEKRRIMIDLPDDIPVGPVELTIHPLATDETPRSGDDLTREEARARLIAAGLLTPGIKYAPDDAVELTPEEEEELGRVLAGHRPMSDLIDEDRAERI